MATVGITGSWKNQTSPCGQVNLTQRNDDPNSGSVVLCNQEPEITSSSIRMNTSLNPANVSDWLQSVIQEYDHSTIEIVGEPENHFDWTRFRVSIIIVSSPDKPIFNIQNQIERRLDRDFPEMAFLNGGLEENLDDNIIVERAPDQQITSLSQSYRLTFMARGIIREEKHDIARPSDTRVRKRLVPEGVSALFQKALPDFSPDIGTVDISQRYSGWQELTVSFRVRERVDAAETAAFIQKCIGESLISDYFGTTFLKGGPKEDLDQTTILFRDPLSDEIMYSSRGYKITFANLNNS